ncbi:hypothetical protein UlMin_021893 [Ulmus minor]
MNLAANYSNTNLNFIIPHKPHENFRFLLRNPFQIREFRVFRRRRIKRTRKLAFRSQLDPLDDLFNDVVTQFSSANSLKLIAPALGLASGVALYLSRLGMGNFSGGSDVGEWILFTSPTPFNRFVLLRCPSISFEGGELLEGVNEKLVKEDRHYVRFDSGRILAKAGDGILGGLEEKLEYQRVCVSTDDGGVISLDWPANLDLKEEHGLDTTLLLVPGSPEGSMDLSIRSFVCETLKRGCFPIVMNPRGCAGSPLTTPRLFTAADSDDICTAIQFINNARPCTTLMGVGWGYGANMLTKYLAEVGEGTPLTAATCIDNPFDLEEATRSSPHHMAIDRKLTSGLIDILRSNKELFRGRAKGYDVEKALSAKSIRDFEKAISMVSHGCETIEDFYSKSSTRNLIRNVKIPVLFIQNVEGSAPLFSIPRSLIAENPFTSLLLCSYLPSSGIFGGRSAVTWYQQLTIEWLAAVELGLLKGRHPLLKDVDITINPTKGIAFREDKEFYDTAKVTKLLDHTPSCASTGYGAHSTNDMFKESDTTAGLILRVRKDLQGKYEIEGTRSQEAGTGELLKTNSSGADMVTGEEVSPVDSDSSKVLQTTQVVMNMLDVTMPGTLTEEKKKKVVTAVGQGETLINALQDAVPDDVRDKLTTAVSGILHTQGTQLKINELLDTSQVPSVSSGLKPKTEEKVRGASNSEGLSQDTPSSDQMKRTDSPLDSSINNQPGIHKPSAGVESEHPETDSSQKSTNSGQSQSISSDGSNNSSSIGRDSSDSGNMDNYDESSKGKGLANSENIEKGLEMGSKPSSSSHAEKGVGAEANVLEEKKDQTEKLALSETKGENDANNEEKSVHDQNKMTSPGMTGEASSPGMTGEASSPSGSSSDAQPMEKEDNDTQKRDNKNAQPVLDQTKSTSESNAPTFGVSQAFDALTGMDDSTQVAVNSVFGVIENMITQLEESSENENEVKDDNFDSEIGNHNPTGDKRLENSEATLVKQILQPNSLTDDSVVKCHENSVDSRIEKVTQSPISLNGNSVESFQRRNTSNHVGQNRNREGDHLTGSDLLHRSSDKIKRVDNIPVSITSNPYFHTHLVSKLPTESLDSDATSALLLEYIPEEGQWKLLDLPENNGSPDSDVGKRVHTRPPQRANDRDKVIEPTYVIFDTEKPHEPTEEYEKMDNKKENAEIDEHQSEELIHLVENIIVGALKVEVGRRLSSAGMTEMEPSLARDLEHVATAVSRSVQHDKKHNLVSDVRYHGTKVGMLHGELIIMTISSAVPETSHLRKVLPLGVIIGSSLAALRNFFDVDTVHDEDLSFDEGKKLGENDLDKSCIVETRHVPSTNSAQISKLNGSVGKEEEKAESNNISNGTVMVGAVTAALGASALFVQHQDSSKSNETVGGLPSSSKMKADNQKEPEKLEDNQNSVVTSLAEKAMSVASPVVPTKGDGEVDQERLVALLADLGQRGGLLRLVGKVALLWGGIRGAMSLTEKLLSFLHISERPLIQRILGFIGMVLILWSPVVVPLLPTLVQSWTTKTPSMFAQFACIIGLYTAVMILVTLWGKRIRGFENPLEQYGLDLTSLPKIYNFLKGLVGGVMLVLSIQSVNALIGCVDLSWPYGRFSFDSMTWLKVCGKMLVVVGQGIVTATGVALVEELLFRSWLPEEIAADYGYHPGILISGLAFSLLQRSPWSIPGLWLLSLSLAGVRQRAQGSLSVSIGLRAGILASNFALQRGGFLIYKPNFPLWITGTHPFQPFSGVTGLAFTLSLALLLYPRQPIQTQSLKKTTEE